MLGESAMPYKKSYRFIRRLLDIQTDIFQLDQLLIQFEQDTDSENVSISKKNFNDRYDKIQETEPLWFIIFGTIISSFLPSLLVVWSYRYLRSQSVIYDDIPGMIGLSVILALLCGLIRFIFLITREIKADSQAAERYVQSIRTIKKSAEDFVEQALSAADLPKNLKSYDILFSTAQALKRNPDMPIKAALIQENPVFIPLPKSVSPSYIMVFLLLRKTKKHLKKRKNISFQNTRKTTGQSTKIPFLSDEKIGKQ